MKQQKIFLWVVCSALSLLPVLVMRGNYYPVLDDYIMYQGYPLYSTSYLLNTVRVWTARPVANLLDVFVWSRLSQSLFLLFCIFTVLKLLSVYFLRLFFEQQGWATGPMYLLLLLCPVGVEATGWLSAASRIITGLFFMSVGLWFLIRNRLGWFSLFMLLSFGCYEQFWLLGSLLSAYELWNGNKKRIWIPFLLAAGMGMYTIVCQNWSTTPRIGQGLNLSLGKEVLELWQVSLFRLIPQSIARGSAHFSLWFMIGALLLLLLLSLYWQPQSVNRKSRLFGLLLIVACYLPFLVTHQGLSFRMVYLSLIGLSLILPPKRWIWIPLAFFFCIGSAGELKDYQNAGICDASLLNQIAEGVTEEPRIYYESSVSYGQHILSVTHSKWSLTAGLRAVTKNTKAEELVP